MKIGYIGLGKMGKNMVLRLLEHNIEVVAWNRSQEPLDEVVAAGAVGSTDATDLLHKLEPVRIVWLMLPAGVTTQMLSQLLPDMNAGDILIDGSNSHYRETQHKAELCQAAGIRYIDVGVSGGPDGARNGACCMVGGDAETFTLIEPIIKVVSAPDAYQFFSGTGAGHFVKMIHNGIEYGMMQAIGEGFAIMRNSEFNLDLEDVARIYNTRSVIESRLIGWLQSGFQAYGQDLAEIPGTIGHLGEGKWTVETGEELGIPTPIIAGAYQFRLDSKQNPSYTGKVVQTLRNQFGGHQAIDTLEK